MVLFCILILSAYVHLWNPVGFPDIFFDEGVYMRRAMHLLETGSPQEGFFYDHPYWGQIVLAGFLKIAGFPSSVEQSIELSYLVPRVLMGIFAVLDTFLVYEIAFKKFGKRTAVIAAVLFAVMPITWMLRRILLDTILLPFLLSSILLALHSCDSKNKNLLIVSSSICLGLAIFTKVTAVTMIPVVGYIIYSNFKNKNDLFKLLPGTFLIPLIWPAVSLLLGHMNHWFNDVFWQAQRGSGGFLAILYYLFTIDIVTTGLGVVSFAFAIYTRKLFLIFWFLPFLLFISAIGFLQYFHFVLILPVMCISIGVMLQTVFLRRIQNTRIQNYCFIGTVAIIIVLGTVASTMLFNINLTDGQFQALNFIIDNLDDKDTTLLAGPVYTWILSDVHKKDNVLPDYSSILFEPIRTEKIMLVADPHFISDIDRGAQLQNVYDDSLYGITIHNNQKIEKFNSIIFPYGSLKFTTEGNLIEIKTNWNFSQKSPT